MKVMIIHAGGFTVLGGIERVVLNLGNYLMRKHNSLELVSICNLTELQKKVIIEFERFNVSRYKSKTNSRILKIFPRLILGIEYTRDWKIISDILHKNNPNNLPDVILVTLPHFILDVKKALKHEHLNIKVVYWPHNSLDRTPLIKSLKDRIGDVLFQFILKKSLSKTDASLAIATEFKNQIMKINSSKPVYVVFNPTNNYEGPLIKRSAFTRFLFVGRFDDTSKNISFLFKAMSKIKDKKWELLMVGGKYDELELKKLAKQLGKSFDERIKWLGWKKDPYENLDEGITALLFTSRYEGFGMVLIEANQRGIPVISSDCEVGPSDIVIPGKNGYLYPEGDMIKFVEIVKDVIDGRLGFDTPENIAKTAERFSEEKVGENILKALKEIIKS